MSEDSAGPTRTTPAKHDPSQLALHRRLGHDLIPLYRWDHVDAGGRERGKSPRDTDWRNRPYPGFDAEAHMAAGGNVGVRLSASALAVDVDARHGGLESLPRLCADVGLDPLQCPTVVTGGGGRHLHMRKDPGSALLVSLEQYPGIELKTLGTQAVAAGSVHPSGAPYEWEFLTSKIAPRAPERLMILFRREPRPAATGGGELKPEELAAMLARLDPARFASNERWFALAAASHHATLGEGRQEFLDWSLGDGRYASKHRENARRWDSLHASGAARAAFTVRTLYHELREAGAGDAIPRATAAGDFAHAGAADAPPGAVATAPGSVMTRGLEVNSNGAARDTIANALSAVSGAGLGVAWDELKQQAVFRAKDLPWDEAKYGRALDDNNLRMVRLLLIERHQGNRYQPGKDNLLEALMTVAYGHAFNPISEYLDRLRWDGTTRVEALAHHLLNCDGGEYEAAVSRCFMVGAVRRVRRPGCKFDTMPIMRGPQGWNKSSAVRELFGAEWFSDAAISDLKDKDAAMLIRGIWVQEFAELDTMNKAEVGTMKGFMSRATDRLRDPFDRVVKDVPRRCVFFGTVNEGGYLKDGTGSRRFWPLEVRATIDLERIRADRDQLWAEAAALEAAGESDVLPQRLWERAGERQAEETSEDPWADILGRFLADRAYSYAIDDREQGPPQPPDKVLTSELFRALGIDPSKQNRGTGQRIRTVMENQLGWKHSRGVRIGGVVGAGYTRR